MCLARVLAVGAVSWDRCGSVVRGDEREHTPSVAGDAVDESWVRAADSCWYLNAAVAVTMEAAREARLGAR